MNNKTVEPGLAAINQKIIKIILRKKYYIKCISGVQKKKWWSAFFESSVFWSVHNKLITVVVGPIIYLFI